jgi:hypothetical protein
MLTTAWVLPPVLVLSPLLLINIQAGVGSNHAIYSAVDRIPTALGNLREEVKV